MGEMRAIPATPRLLLQAKALAEAPCPDSDSEDEPRGPGAGYRGGGEAADSPLKLKSAGTRGCSGSSGWMTTAHRAGAGWRRPRGGSGEAGRGALRMRALEQVAPPPPPPQRHRHYVQRLHSQNLHCRLPAVMTLGPRKRGSAGSLVGCAHVTAVFAPR